MTNLILKIRGNRLENTSSDVLVYLLEKYDPCLAGFMSLFNIETNNDSCRIESQYWTDTGTPDLVISDNKNQWRVVIENKPWLDSSFTGDNDQMKRYADQLKKCNFQRKTLCLLATEGNKEELVQAANIGVKEGVEFVVVTWEAVLEKLASIHPENTIPGFIIKELREYLFPYSRLPIETRKKIDSFKDNFDNLKKISDDAKVLLLRQAGNTPLRESRAPSGKSPNWWYQHIDGPQWGKFHFGPALEDCNRLLEKNGTPKYPFFFFSITGDGKLDRNWIPGHFLEDKCGFHFIRYSNWWLFFKPLEIDANDNGDAQKIADAVMKIVDEISVEYDKGIAQ